MSSLLLSSVKLNLKAVINIKNKNNEFDTVDCTVHPTDRTLTEIQTNRIENDKTVVGILKRFICPYVLFN